MRFSSLLSSKKSTTPSSLFGGISRGVRAIILASVAIASFVTSAAIPALSVTSTESSSLVQLSGVEQAYAAGTGSGSGNSDSKVADVVLGGINDAYRILYIVYVPAVMFAGWLLSPDWTFGQIFGLRTVIHNLWVMISNITYVFFAFALVAMAFMNIFGKGGDLAIKTALPRFVVGIIIVPFTWFIVSAVLSLSNILTASVLRLPYDVMSERSKAIELSIPANCTLNFADAKTPAAEGAASTGTKQEFFKCDTKEGDAKITLGEIFTSERGAYNLLVVYAYSVFKADKLKDITPDVVKTLKNVSDVSVSLIVGLVSYFAFGLIVIALCSALITRAVYMWVFAIFSPLFGFLYFLGSKSKASSSLEKQHFSFSKFVGLAMVPVVVSGALAFGLMFLTMTQNFTPDSNEIQSTFFNQSQKSSENGSAIFSVGKMNITVNGLPTFTAPDGVTKAAVGVGVFGASAIGQIIVSILGLVILWMTFKAAMSTSEITEKAAKPVLDFGDEIGKLMKSLPMHTPIPGLDGKTMMGMSKLPSIVLRGIEGKSAGSTEKLGNTLSDAVTSAMHLQNSKTSDIFKAVDQLERTSRPSNTHSSQKDHFEKIHGAFQGSVEEIWKDANLKTRYLESLTTMGAIDKDFATTLSNATGNAVASELTKNQKFRDYTGVISNDPAMIAFLSAKSDPSKKPGTAAAGTASSTGVSDVKIETNNISLKVDGDEIQLGWSINNAQDVLSALKKRADLAYTESEFTVLARNIWHQIEAERKKKSKKDGE